MTGDSRAGDDNSLSLIGSTIAGKYQILSLIGEGGMGSVYKASHLLIKGIVAIKMMHPNMAEPNKLKRFQQEAQTTFKLSHPNIIKVLDFGVSDAGRPYLVMDYLKGKSLSDVIKEQGRVPVDRLLDITIRTCAGLTFAHSMGIVHRDLKPSNIMLVQSDSDWDSVRIVDFGIAKVIPTAGEELQRLTQTGELFGSPYYMSPEQCMGQEPDARSDVYSMGCLMYEALVGDPPFKGSFLFETLNKHLNEMPPALAIPGCDRAILERLDSIVFKALEKSPDKRYQSMAEMKSDLEAVQKELSGGAGFWRSLSGGVMQILRQSRRWVAAHPRIASAAVVVLLTAPAASSLPAVYGMLTRRGPSEQKVQWQVEPVKFLPKPPDFDQWVGRKHHYAFMLKDADDPGNFGFLNGLDNLVDYCAKYGDWNLAAFYQEIIMDVYRKQGVENTPLYAREVEHIGDCQFYRGRFAEARQTYKNLVGLQTAVYGPDRLEVTKPLSRIAEIYLLDGNPKQAAKYYEEALRVWTQHGELSKDKNPECPEIAIAEGRLADIYRLEGNFGGAEDYYEGLLKYWRNVQGGPLRVNEGLCLDRLALVCASENKTVQAESFYRQAVTNVEKSMGAENPFVATVLQNYADLLWRQNRFLEAIQMKLRAAEILSKPREHDTLSS